MAKVFDVQISTWNPEESCPGTYIIAAEDDSEARACAHRILAAEKQQDSYSYQHYSVDSIEEMEHKEIHVPAFLARNIDNNGVSPENWEHWGVQE